MKVYEGEHTSHAIGYSVPLPTLGSRIEDICHERLLEMAD